MIRRRWALLYPLILAAMFRAESAAAGVWITEPVIGVAAEYSTNPALLYVPHSSETDGAVLIDAPTTYHADNESFSIQPSFRFSNRSAYSSLTSDYEHLTGVGEIDSEVGTLKATAEVARDSSLYYNYSFNGSSGVRRDTASADLSWTRALTERFNFNWDIISSRVIYGESNTFQTLIDYHYSNASPTLAWNADERTVLKLLAGVGIYDSSDDETKSVNSNAQLGIERKLNERWTLSASAGYSRESNSVSTYEYIPVYIGPFLIGFNKMFVHLKSTESGTVFNGSLARKGELLSVSAVASRSVVPTGFAFLATQTSYAIGFDYPRTERWTFDATAQRTTSREPQAFGPVFDYSYLSISLSAAWAVSEKWTLKLQASRVSARYSPPFVDVASTDVSLELSRHFDPITWQ